MDNAKRSPGQIVTFYSYKGGTGRSMALANIAWLLARVEAKSDAPPPRILAIDWDFEAPGLHRYFRPYLSDEAERGFDAAPGCLDIFVALNERQSEYGPRDFVANRRRARAALEAVDFDAYLLRTSLPGLSFIKAGRFDENYQHRVSEFRWETFFKATVGLFNGFADFLRDRYDWVLVDSRTGITDTSGICTVLLPDRLVVVFTPNQQSLTGIENLVRKAVAYRKESPDGRPLTVFPLPSRIEMARPKLLEAWRYGTGTDSSASAG